MIFGKVPKCRYFPKIRQIIALKINPHRSDWKANLPQYGYIVPECGNAVKRGFFIHSVIFPRIRKLHKTFTQISLIWVPFPLSGRLFDTNLRKNSTIVLGIR
jgi:hypothetical protein